MKTTDIDSLFQSADNDLKSAGEELCRPMEDVMCSAVCIKARNSIYNYLRGYALFNRHTPPQSPSVDESRTYRDLIMECIRFDKSFGDIPVYPLQCSWSLPDQKDVYCFSFYKVKECYDLALSIKEHVNGKIKSQKNNMNGLSHAGRK
ncbi:MAG: hypothetical protein HYY40_01350 [Bacteroidetes bacterium]|nr:hypothetical protein [Bacteroidota bacterium]